MPGKATKPAATKVAAKKPIKKKVVEATKPVVVEEPKKRAKKVVDTTQVRELNPRDPDLKYSGPEPKFLVQPEEGTRLSKLAKAFTWYHWFYDRKHAKEFLCQYLDLKERNADAKVMRKVDHTRLNITLCWLSRMELRGLELTEHEEHTLENHITSMLRSVTNPEPKIVSQTGKKAPKVAEVKVTNRPSVQEIMKEKAREAAGEIEGMYDDYVMAGAKASHNFKPVDELVKKNVLPQHIYIFTDAWQRKRDEIAETLEGKDAQLVQAYGHYTKTQLKNLLKFIDSFIADFNSYVSMKKAAKAPRARKAVPVEKQVAKLKFLKEFKDPAMKIELVSLHPVKLHGASEAWVYDTSKRKLHHYVADEYSKTFTVKGNTLLGFDSGKSQVKTLRKPGEQLKEVMGSKPAARKFFDGVRAVAVKPNGRFNDSMLILRCF